MLHWFEGRQRGLGKEAAQHWLASLRVAGMMESGKSREPWLLDTELGPVTPNTPGVPSLGGEQEGLFVATISGGHPKGNTGVQESRDHADIQSGGMEDCQQ